MKGILKICCYLLLAAIACGAGTTLANDNDSRRLIIDRDVDTFAVLPNGVRFPEGITANPANGDIYVGTFDGGNQNKLLRYNRHGRLVASLNLGIAPLLGLEFDRANKKVYFASIGDFTGVPGLDSKIRRVAADLTGLQDVATIPGIGAPGPRTVGNPDGSSDTITFGSGARVPNAMVFDSDGNLYVSDSFQGAIFRITNPEAARQAARWKRSVAIRCLPRPASPHSVRMDWRSVLTRRRSSSRIPATTACSSWI